MQLCRQAQTLVHRKNASCVVTQYPMANPALNFAIVRIDGRYPEQGRALNTVCQEIIYVQEGSGKVNIDGQEYPLQAGDTVLIEAGEILFWQGQFSLCIACHPAYFIDQHQLVD